jgi:hypothetical protein
MSEHCRLQDGTWFVICPICGSVRPAQGNKPVDEPVYCRLNCYLLGHRNEPIEFGENPSRDDGAAIRFEPTTASRSSRSSRARTRRVTMARRRAARSAG